MLVGDGPEFSRTQALVGELGLADRVRFVGVVDEVASLLSAADLLLLPSETESFGLVALEAMASGVPVVASRVGGLPEVVEHGVTGYLAPVGDVEAMAELQPGDPVGLRDAEAFRGGGAGAGACASSTGTRWCRATRRSTGGWSRRPVSGIPSWPARLPEHLGDVARLQALDLPHDREELLRFLLVRVRSDPDPEVRLVRLRDRRTPGRRGLSP